MAMEVSEYYFYNYETAAQRVCSVIGMTQNSDILSCSPPTDGGSTRSAVLDTSCTSDVEKIEDAVVCHNHVPSFQRSDLGLRLDFLVIGRGDLVERPNKVDVRHFKLFAD